MGYLCKIGLVLTALLTIIWDFSDKVHSYAGTAHDALEFYQSHLNAPTCYNLSKLISSKEITIMPKRTASAVWEGTLREGNGKVKLGSGAFEGQYSFISRFEGGTGTYPEELVGAAHAGCFSVALAAGLTKAGHNPTSISTNAAVTLEKVGEGFNITTIELTTEGVVPGIDDQTFLDAAESAKKNCPVSQALAGVDIKLNATLLKSAAA